MNDGDHQYHSVNLAFRRKKTFKEIRLFVASDVVSLVRSLARQANGEAANWRQKFESGESAVVPDVEEIKKKMSLKVTECESRLGSAQAKIGALEKINVTLQQETEAFVAELDKVRGLLPIYVLKGRGSHNDLIQEGTHLV